MVVKYIVVIYVGIILFGSLVFWGVGMSLFDVVNYVMLVIFIGGFFIFD